MMLEEAKREEAFFRDAIRATAPNGFLRAYGIHLVNDAALDVRLLLIASDEGMLGPEER